MRKEWRRRRQMTQLQKREEESNDIDDENRHRLRPAATTTIITSDTSTAAAAAAAADAAVVFVSGHLNGLHESGADKLAIRRRNGRTGIFFLLLSKFPFLAAALYIYISCIFSAATSLNCVKSLSILPRSRKLQAAAVSLSDTSG